MPAPMNFPTPSEEPLVLTWHHVRWTRVPVSAGQHFPYWRSGGRISTLEETAELDRLAALEAETDGA